MDTPRQTRWLLSGLLAAALGTACLKAADAGRGDAERVRSRLEADLLQQEAEPAKADQLRASQAPDGSWADIDYGRRDSSLWPPVEHLVRLRTLALASLRGEPGGRAVLRAAAERGLDFWVRRDPQSDNWWWNTIGLQQALAPVMTLLRSDLMAGDPAAWRSACAQLGRSTVEGKTGANLLWEAKNLFVLGALTDDGPLMARMARRAEREIAVTTAEGIQPDFSFHQHGPQLNAGNYGLSFLPTACDFALLLQGTRLQWPAERIAILERFEAGFQEWVVWGRDLDLSSCGRQVDLPNEQRDKAAEIAKAGLLLAQVDPSSAGHWRRFLERVRGEAAPADGGPVGDRLYWRSDFLVHRPGGWYASVKMYSPRVRRTETEVNQENFRGYHLCDGMTSFLVRGDEYQNIQPVWDWRKLPGVTFKATRAPFPYGPKTGDFNPCPFVGGASDGAIGAAAMDLVKEDVRCRKAWFCFAGGVVCLGADIACPSPEPVTTDVNQCLLRGPAKLLRGSAWTRVPPGSSARPEGGAGTAAIWHDKIGYVLLSPARWQLTVGPQVGAWSLLRKEGVSAAPVTRGVFNLWIDHGARPSGGSYAYAVLPGRSPAEVARFAAAPSYRVLRNDAALQAAADETQGVVCAVFRRPGSVPAAAGLPSLSAAQPCVAILRRDAGRLVLFAADPTQALPRLEFELPGGVRLTAALPAGGLAGSTVRIETPAETPGRIPRKS